MLLNSTLHLSNPSRDSSDEIRLRGRWLILVRVVWVIFVVPPLMLFITQIPSYFAALHLLRSSNAQPFTGQLTLHDVQALQALGLSLDFYAACMVAVSLLFQFSYATMGVLLFCRKPDDRMALQASFALMLSPFGFAYLTLQTLPAGWLWVIPTLSFLGNASIMICAYVFPNGKFVPRWTRWLALVLIGYWAGVAIFPSMILNRFWLNFALFFGLALSTMLVQVYRYRYISNGQQRQQTKWIVFGISVAVAGNIGARFLSTFVLLPPPGGSSLADVVEALIITFSMLVIPFTLGIAILSSRLWDIDVLINRTLVYGSLTAILALAYFGIIIVLQAVVSGLTGQFSAVSHSPLVPVVSTLGIAALFQPLRHYIQALIDRRFYRHKYDAARILGTFSTALRNEVDLNQVSEQLVEVVQETMQPTYVSLWLLNLEPPKERKTRLLPIIDEEENMAS